MENNLKDQHYKNMGIKPQMETLTFEAESYRLHSLQPFWSGYFRIFVYLYRQLVREQGYEGVESINGYHPKNICRDHWEH